MYSLEETTGRLVPARIKGLLDMGVKPVFKLKTAGGKEIRTTGNHPYLVKVTQEKPLEHSSEIAGAGWVKVMDLKEGDKVAVANDNFDKLMFPAHHSRQSHQDNDQTNYSQNQIYQQNISHYAHLLNQRLISQQTNMIGNPNPTANGLNLSRKPGSTTDAKATNATSEAISDNFSSWRWLSTGNDNSIQNHPNIAGSDLQWDTIASINYVGEEQVYDIEVENTHNFVANGIIAHNTYLNGNVGIGTSSPAGLLDVDGSTGIRLNTTQGSATAIQLIARAGGIDISTG
ncbi:hypothetical protein HYZ78_00010, partial [Candidatus Microgenomates bacterium]|nr:hypothetical protein [Candidatus Microgenomates bacterium]